ncbi:hypothetical protein SAMN05216456_2392 [Devosia crocina]|uniref:Uncharacterized protein n=1 Tax=Devosia crocina TaxID=429728 RepID=A0A1I7NNJ2_9HYPH|nr:hypothetical protein [Devosia crocina]SFV36238.1 hypothetical protein SAMN05216456_2392 [Devosia crocina]
MFLRILLIIVIGLAVYFGIRRIWKDWTRKFDRDAEDAKLLRRQRDLEERQRPDVIDLKRDDDGTFRPGDRPEPKDRSGK